MNYNPIKLRDEILGNILLEYASTKDLSKTRKKITDLNNAYYYGGFADYLKKYYPKLVLADRDRVILDKYMGDSSAQSVKIKGVLEVMDIARQDTATELAKDIYAQQIEIIQHNGLRISVIPVQKVRDILPEKPPEF